jgi:MYXO-CTERM domain-containing protein
MTSSTPKNRLKNLARVLPAAALCLWALPANANLLSNGTFDSAKDPWWGNASTTSDPPADQAITVEDGKLCSTSTSGGKNPWDVVVGYSGVALEAGKYYHIAFTVTADADRTIKYKTGLGAAPYSDYFIQTIPVSATPQDVSITYLNLHADPMAQFQFQIGKVGGKVCFDNIVLEEAVAPVEEAYATPSMTGQPLKSRPAVVTMGTAVDTPIFLSNPRHNLIVANEFSMITPANSMKMNLIQPTEGTFDFTDTDGLLAWAQSKGLDFRGHPLVWHTQAPSWIKDTMFTRDEMIAKMYAHIDGLMSHYKGKIKYWDVVNEAIDDAGAGFRPTFWHDTIGDDFMDLAFSHARAADPDAKLFYNDYNAEQAGNPKGDKVFEVVKSMKDRGIPIDGIGLQSHYFVTPDGGLSGVPNMDAIKANMDRYAQAGLEVHITECDFRLGKPLDQAKLDQHTQFFSGLLQKCIDAQTCTHFTVWGLSDIDSWVPSTFPDYDYAHLYDSQLMPRPAYQAMNQVFAKYNPDGTPVGGGSQTTSSGCAMAPAGTSGKTGSAAALLALLGLAVLSRRTAKRRGS